jgi:hypothetical protein
MALNTDMTKYIFESPDGGETIYRRELGEQHRELVQGDPEQVLQESQKLYRWRNILRLSDCDPELKELIDRVEVYYRLKHDAKV